MTQKAPDETPAPETPDANDPQPAAADRTRKERVIHTRVPAVLEAELKRFAENMRIPVSNLIRTILEDAVAVADRASESVERELRTVAQRVGNEREKLKRAVARDPLEGVFGFQPLTLNVETACAKCGTALLPGTVASLALSDRPGARIFVCSTCVPGPAPSTP